MDENKAKIAGGAVDRLQGLPCKVRQIVDRLSPVEREHRNQIVEAAVKIKDCQRRVDELVSQLSEAQRALNEAEEDLDQLVMIAFATEPYENGIPDEDDAGIDTDDGATIVVESEAPEGVRIPICVGTLTDQALSFLNANPALPFAAGEIVAALNKMEGRSNPAQAESVYAALSRLVANGQIARVEHGFYRAKEKELAMTT